MLGRAIDGRRPGWSEICAADPGGEQAGEPVRAETVPVEFGGRELWISVSGVGFEEGTVYAFRDLTEERALEEMKADFVATVSHELRTPLAAIYGSAQTIRRTDIDLDPRDPRPAARRDRVASRPAGRRSSTTCSSRAGSTPTSCRSRSSSCDAARARDARWSSAAGRISRSRRARAGRAGRGCRASPPTPASCTRCSRTSSTTRSSTRPRAARSRVARRDGDGSRSASRSPTAGLGIPRVGAPADLREVLPPRSRHDPRHRRHRARPLHLPRARAPDGREDLGRVEARRGLDLLRRAPGSRT